MKYRSEIDGLRALAVTLVIFAHLGIAGFTGGYIGVDIFFVISGYLITSILIDEYQNNLVGAKTGWISFRSFYLRRIKRIVPMAITVIVIALIYANLAYSQARFTQVKNDAIWASLFSANLHFMRESLNYFAQAQAVSPLQHYWSLAVEEQFYVVFPALFLLVARIKIKTTSWLILPIITVSLISTLSLAHAISASQTSSAQSYFSSFDRAYELGIGALVALSLFRFTLKPFIGQLMSASGLLLIIWATISFDGGSHFPGWNALVPTIGTALILVSETKSSKLTLVGANLGRKSIAYVGKISYSMYLWHWLVIIIVKDQLTVSTLTKNLIVIVSTVLLSILSYRFIEHPIRRLPVPSNFLTPIKISSRTKIASLLITSLVGVLVLTGGNGWFDSATVKNPVATATSTSSPSGVSTPDASLAPEVIASPSPTAAITDASPTASPIVEASQSPQKAFTYSELLAAFKSKVSAGNSLFTVPKSIFPTISQLIPLRDAQWRLCMDVAIKEVTCEFGNKSATKTAVILGDSYALATYTMILGALDLTQWHVIALNMRECMVADVMPIHWGEAGGLITSCPQHREWSFDYLKANPPDLIFMSEQPYHPIANGDKDSGDAHDQLWEEGLQRSLQTLHKLPSKIISFGVPDSGWGTDLVNCTNAQGAIKRSCFGSINAYRNYVQIQKYSTESVGGLFIDMKSWICDLGSCPPIIDNTPVFYDGAHFSEAFGTKMAPLLAALLREAGLIS